MGHDAMAVVDEQGRVYRSKVYNVNQANGTPHPRSGRKLCFSLAISLFISARPSRLDYDP